MQQRQQVQLNRDAEAAGIRAVVQAYERIQRALEEERAETDPGDLGALLGIASVADQVEATLTHYRRQLRRIKRGLCVEAEPGEIHRV